MMTPTNGDLPIKVLPDISERAADLKARLLEGETMSMQNIADVLGLDFELFAVAVAIHYVLRTGTSVCIDPAPAPKMN